MSNPHHTKSRLTRHPYRDKAHGGRQKTGSELDQMRAVLCGAGYHHLLMILREVRLLCTFVLAAPLTRQIAGDVVA